MGYKIKNTESENNHITIVNTFWFTEFNFGLFQGFDLPLIDLFEK